MGHFLKELAVYLQVPDAEKSTKITRHVYEIAVQIIPPMVTEKRGNRIA